MKIPLAATALIMLLLSLVVTAVVYPHILSFALRHNIVDKPNARKLQRAPVPVMGGATIFAGFLVAMLFVPIFFNDIRIMPIVVLTGVMFFIGLWDDRNNLSASLRFVIELIVIWFALFWFGAEINDFHGFLGVHFISDMFSVPLSLIAGVGIINAINLIDGVDGYCSSYGIIASMVFAILFYKAGDNLMCVVALITMGALVPFFFHNVFGKKSKMFLGDGGSLFLGTLISMFVFTALYDRSYCSKLDETGISLVALTLATLSIPVFDTLRVMTARVLSKHSPFKPDKTHLHHIFIEMDFSHLATSGIIMLMNLFIVLVELLLWLAGASVNVQVFTVIVLSVLATCGVYYGIRSMQTKNDGEGSPLYRKLCVYAQSTHFRSKKWWKAMTRVVDGPTLGIFEVDRKALEEKKTRKIDPRIS